MLCTLPTSGNVMLLNGLAHALWWLHISYSCDSSFLLDPRSTALGIEVFPGTVLPHSCNNSKS